MTGVPGFPGIGPVGNVGIVDTTNNTQGATVTPDGELWIGGSLAYSILAELRVQTQLLATLANVPIDLRQARADAIADMGAIYTANPPTPVLSS